MTVVRSVDVGKLVEFADKRRVRKFLIGSTNIESELVCYEPGQGTREHFHRDQDEIYFIVEGSGVIVVGGERTAVSAGSMLFAPKDTPHSIETSDERMVMLFFKGPGRPQPPAGAASGDGGGDGEASAGAPTTPGPAES
jgi:mannose-6-phosphate isomerase-like protein (cupin superfamily)